MLFGLCVISIQIKSFFNFLSKRFGGYRKAFYLCTPQRESVAVKTKFFKRDSWYFN